MKSIKTSLAGFLVMVLVFSGLFLTCDVGLGDSVDTKPPKVSVTSPAVDSVIAGTFVLQGKASDDNALKSVSVMATETTTGAAYGPFKANLDSDAKTWSVNINETDANGAFIIPDGMYQLTVTAADKANRTSVATTVYQIDNHLPTVLVTSPLSYGVAKTTFYRTIDISGEVYDGSTIQEVIVQIVGSDGAALASMKADGTNTWFARFDYKASDTTLADNAVYGMNVLAKDMAGNVNTYYYHRSDIYPCLSAGSDGYVTFPSMNQIGKVDQGLGAETDQGLTKDELAALRHGQAATAELKYPDFIYRNVEPPKVQWLNITDAMKTIGLNVPIVGTILPPTDGSSIVESSIQFSISNVITPSVSIPQPASRVSLSNVASSYNFEVLPGNVINENLGTGLYVIKVIYKTVGGLTLEATREFGISSGAPTLKETGLAGPTSPFNFTKSVKDSVTLSGTAKTSDGNASSLAYTDTYNEVTTSYPVTVAADGSYSIPLTFVGVDGTHTIKMTASSGGLEANLSRILVVDTTPAAINFLNPVATGTPAPEVKGSSPNYMITVNGTADDDVGSGISKVYAIVDSVENKYITGGTYDFSVWTTCNGTINWSTDVPIAPVTEGLKYLYIAAVDVAGNAKVDSIDFIFDISTPVANFSKTTGLTSFTAPATDPAINTASFTLGGFAHDDALDTGDAFCKPAKAITLSCVKNNTVFDLTSASDSVTDYAINPATLVNGEWSWSTTGITMPDGLYVFTLTVRDDAGKIIPVEQKVLIDTYAPTIVVAAPANDSLYVTTPGFATGSVSDAGTGYLATDVSATFNGVPQAISLDKNSWSASLAMSTQGPQEFIITAKDRFGKVATVSRSFYFDTDPPTLTLDPVTAILTTIPGSGFSITGTMTDSYGLDRLEIKQRKNGVADVSIATQTGLSNGSFGIASLPRDPDNPGSLLAEDGLYEYTFLLTDRAGRTTQKTCTVTIDTKAPVFADIKAAGLNTVSDGISYYSDKITFTGTAKDGKASEGASGTELVECFVNGTSVGTAVSGTDFWSIELDLTSEPESSYDYTFKATDNAGHVANSSSVTVNLDHKPPRATFDTPTEADGFKLIDPSNKIYAIGNTFSLGGIADDDDFNTVDVAVRTAKEVVLTWTKDGNKKTLTPTLKTDGTWAWASSSGPVNSDGLYVFNLTVTDVAGKVSTSSCNIRVDTTPPTINTPTAPKSEIYTTDKLGVGKTLNIGGSIEDFGSGPDAVTYILTNNGVQQAPVTVAVDTSGDWSAQLDFNTGGNAAGEGEKKITLTAKDKFGNTTLTPETITFYYDDMAPTLTVATPASELTGYDTDGSVPFAGTWTESNKLESIVIKYKKDGGEETTLDTIPVAGTTSGTNESWGSESYTLTDGSYVFSVVAIDIAKRESNIVKRTIVVDQTNPEISAFTAPVTTPTFYVENALNVSGTAGDAVSGIKEVRYSFDSDVTMATGASWDASWKTGINGFANWNGEINTSGLGLGSHTIFIKAVDYAGRYSASSSKTFIVDRKNPTITETAYISDSVYVKDDFTITLTLDEDYAFDATVPLSVDLIGSPAGAVKTTPTLKTSVSDIKKIYEYKQTNVTAHGDGTYELKFTAKDSVGRVSSITRKVIVDTTAPVVTGEIDLRDVDSAVEGQQLGWHTKSAFVLSGTVTDSLSRVAKVEYRISNDNGAEGSWGDWKLLNYNSSTGKYSGTVNFDDGDKNAIEIRATDNAFNESTATDDPYIMTKFSDIKVDTADPSFDITSPTGAKYSNRTGTFDISVSATDETSKPATAYASTEKDFPGNVNTVSIPLTLSLDSELPAGTYTATIPAGSLLTQLSANDGTKRLYVQVVDTAGRKSYTGAQTVLIDTVKPTAVIKSQSTGDSVNKTIEISGTATDSAPGGVDSGIKDVEVQFLNTPTWVSAISAFTDPLPVMSGTNVWKLTGVDTTKIADEFDSDAAKGGIQLQMKVVVTDNAGNKNESSVCTVTIDQNSDRPVIKLTNVSASETKILKMTNTVFGTVEDDDGTPASILISEDGSFGDIPASKVTYSNGNWSYESSSGDGEKHLYFRVTEAAPSGAVFTTTPDKSDNSFGEPRILLTPSPMPTYANSYVAFKVDNNAPDFSEIKPIIVDRLTPFDFADLEELKTNYVLGGELYSSFALLVHADDENDIATVTVAIPGVKDSDGHDGPFATSPVDAHAINTVMSATNIKAGARYKIVTVTGTDYTTVGADNSLEGTEFFADADGTALTGTGTVALTMNAWKTGTLNAAEVTSGAVVVTVKVTDVPGLSSTLNRTIIVDNTKPSVTVTTPKTNVLLNGNIKVSGTAIDSHAGLDTVTYCIGKQAHVDADFDETNGSPFAWDFTIENIQSYATDEYATLVDVAANIWALPVIMRAKDVAGNVYTYTASEYLLRVDPSGDRPTVTITYPDPTKASNTLGGTIRIFGTATDDDAVASVKFLLDDENDGFANDTPVTVSGTYSWNQTINAAHELDPTGSQLTRTVKYMVQAIDIYGVEGLWSEPQTLIIDKTTPQIGGAEPLQLRQYDGGNNVIAARPYAADMWIKGKWYLTGSIWDESGISNIEVTGNISGNLKDNDEWFVPYYCLEDGHFVEGSTVVVESLGDTVWANVCATEHPNVGDTILITNVSSGIADNMIKGTVIMATKPSVGVVYETNYRLKIPVGKTSGTGNQGFTVRATDLSDPKQSYSTLFNINYDNDAPTIEAIKSSGDSIDAAHPVVQQNYTYTFGSTAEETGSGLACVAFYFRRDWVDAASAPDKANRVYDPMKATGNRTPMTDLNGGTLVNMLPRLAVTGGTRASEYSITHASFASKPGIHVGGLIGIGGTDHLITAYNSGAGTVTWDDSAVDIMIKDASVAYAQIVNNMAAENPASTYDANGYPTSIGKDDGDGMVETFERSGTDYNWTATVNSKNIPDGPITMYYVAMDKAGNVSGGSATTRILNNPPLLAKVTLGTDISGNNAVETGLPETLPAYSVLVDGKRVATGTSATSDFIAKGLTNIDIDVLGGNGALSYNLVAGSTTVTTGGTLRSSGSTSINTISLSPTTLGTTIGDTIVSGTAGAVKDFVFTISDETEICANTDSRQIAVLTVPMQIDAVDDVKPKALIEPFYWRGEGLGLDGKPQNSILNGDKANGRIDIPDAGGNPILSGQVTLRGTVYDDKRIGDIYVRIANMTSFATDIAPTSPNASQTALEGAGYIRVAYFDTSTNPPSWKVVSTNYGTVGWKFTIEPVTYDQTGHLARWSLDWNTASVANRAHLGNAVQIASLDGQPNTSELANEILTSVTEINPSDIKVGTTYQITTTGGLLSAGASSETVGNVFTATSVGTGSGTVKPYSYRPSITVDIRPYIVEMKRVSGTTNRSNLGRYIFRRGENVYFRGFNLPDSGSIYLGGTTTQVTAATYGAATTTPIPSGFTHEFTVPNTANSGIITLESTGSIGLANNVNGTAHSYNSEKTITYAYDGSERWFDDRYVHIWEANNDTRTGDAQSYFRGSNTPLYPSMTYASNGTTGRLYAAWSNESASKMYTTSNSDTAATERYSAFDSPLQTDISWNKTSSSPVIGYNANLMAGGWDTSQSGGVQIYASGASDNNTTYMTGKFYRMELMNHDRIVNQFVGQKIATSSDGHYVSYFDTYTKSLKYGFVKYTDSQTGEYSNWVNVDGTTTGGNDPNVTVTFSSTLIKGDTGRATAAGEYNSISLTTDRRPVIAYYDATHQTVRIAYSTTTAETTTSTGTASGWNVMDAMPADDPNYQFTGKDISMVIDGNGDMHIACYNITNSDLVYIKCKKNSTGFYQGRSSIVDSIGSVGSGADISLKQTGTTYTPYISYYNSAYLETYNGIKMVYDTTPTTDISTTVDKTWEHMTVPVKTTVSSDYRTSIEYNTAITQDFNKASTDNAFWSAAIGFKSEGLYRIAYYAYGE